MLIIGVDTGGTFTDFIWQDGDKQGEYKLLSTPQNPAAAVLTGLRHIAGNKSYRLVHGSTVATNALLEKDGARTALITNRGFEDLIEIGRQDRPELYQLQVVKHPPLVPAEFRYGLPGRVAQSGEIIEELDETALGPLLDELEGANIESIAVSLLFSFSNPKHELLIGKHLECLGLPVSLSHQTLAEFREYERTSTTLINAYVAPRMERYLAELEAEVAPNRFRIMQSNGGSISAQTARRESVRTILSGPAGGALGAATIGRQSGQHKLISFDMGGTSTDVSLIDGELPLTTESTIAGYPVKVPMIDIHTVGAGGGSIARLDRGGSLQVGPQSAGAEPGPICFGRGRELTVTDANLFLGRLIPDQFLGGAMTLEPAKVGQSMRILAAEMELDPAELAEGILAVANTTMERAIKKISVEKGFDPREFCLFSFGGAGGMHAADLARLLQIPKVMIPTAPGILSACGMLFADVIKDYSQTVMLGQEQLSPARLKSLLQPLERQAEIDLQREGVPQKRIELQPLLDMRYCGQSFELMIPLSAEFIASFHQKHAQVYGYSNPHKPLEVVNLRLRAFGRPPRRAAQQQPACGPVPEQQAQLGTSSAVFSGQACETAIFARNRLATGNQIQGPAILVEYSSTIVLPPDCRAEVDPYGHLLIELQGVES